MFGFRRDAKMDTYLDKETSTLFVTNPGISFDNLKSLAKKHNFTIGQTKSGEFVSIPTQYKYTDDSYSLYDDFMNTYTNYDKNYNTLLSAYKTFDLMEENLSEVDLILNTYVAEVLSQGFIDNPLKITISNPKAQSLIEKIFYKNKIYERLPEITKAIAKYGNYGMILCYPYLEEMQDQDNIDNFKQLDVLDDLMIRFVNPKYFKVNVDEYMNVINYETQIENTFVAKNANSSVLSKKIWQPWQFVHALLPSEITEPYGKSMLWSMRSAFDQLTTLEALLAISRAGKVQRLVFYVPLPNGVNIIDAYGYMNEFKGRYLNSIFTDNNAPKAGRKLPGAMSILTLPESADGKKVTVDKIPECDIDLSSTEDVQYFLDKILRNSSLPKGYLVGEDIITTAQALESQDLKLRRTLIPLKKALLVAIMGLIENVLTHAGYDVASLDIKVGLNEPIQLSDDVFTKYKNAMEFIGSMLELNPKMSNINKFQLMIKLGMPADIAQLACSSETINALGDVDELVKFINGKKLKPKGLSSSADDEMQNIGESVTYYVTSKEYLSEHYELSKQFKEFKQYTSNTDRSLKESLLTAKKVYENNE